MFQGRGTPPLRPIDPNRVGRILVRVPNWIGDAVLSLPALEALRRVFPGRHVAVLARPWVAPLYQDHPAVDQLIPFPVDHSLDALGLYQAAQDLRRRRFDLALLLQNAFQAALLTLWAGIPLRLGYATDGRARLLTHAVRRPPGWAGRHQGQYYLGLLRGLGWDAPLIEPRLNVREPDAAAAARRLAELGVAPDQPLLGVCPGAAFGPAKRWPPARFAALAGRAVQRWGLRVLLLGGGAERDACAEIAAALPAASLNLAGRTGLGEVMGLLARCRLCLGNDSGLMHLAAALGRPSLTLFTSTDPAATAPLGSGSRWVAAAVSCAPCLERTCRYRHYACLEALSLEQAWAALEALARDTGGMAS